MVEPAVNRRQAQFLLNFRGERFEKRKNMVFLIYPVSDIEIVNEKC